MNRRRGSSRMGVGGGMRRGSGVGGDGVGSDNYLKLLSQNKN